MFLCETRLTSKSNSNIQVDCTPQVFCSSLLLSVEHSSRDRSILSFPPGLRVVVHRHLLSSPISLPMIIYTPGILPNPTFLLASYSFLPSSSFPVSSFPCMLCPNVPSCFTLSMSSLHHMEFSFHLLFNYSNVLFR